MDFFRAFGMGKLDNVSRLETGLGTKKTPFPTSSFPTSQILETIETYWDDLRGSNIAPKRSDIDPRALQGALENAFIVERSGPGAARFRLTGSYLNTLMGMDVRGMQLSSILQMGLRDDFNQHIQSVFEGPKKFTCRLTAHTDAARAHLEPHLQVDLLLLPLYDDRRELSRALGVLHTANSAGDSAGIIPIMAPCRFDSISNIRTEMISEKPTHIPAPYALPKPQVHNYASGFAEAPTVFEHNPRKQLKGERPYLKLVRS